MQDEAAGVTPIQEMLWEPRWEVPLQPCHRCSEEWGFPSPSHSQSLAGLPEQLSHLSVSVATQPFGTGQPRWTLAQPTFTYLSQGAAVQWTQGSTSFYSVPSFSTPSLTLQATLAVDSLHPGAQAIQRPALLGHAGHGVHVQPQGFWSLPAPQQPPMIGLPSVSQIPPGWAFYSGQ